MLVDNTYHAGTIRDVAAMNAASSTGYTSLNEETGATASEALTVHAFLDGLAQLRDELDNTNEDNISVSTDSVSLYPFSLPAQRSHVACTLEGIAAPPLPALRANLPPLILNPHLSAWHWPTRISSIQTFGFKDEPPAMSTSQCGPCGPCQACYAQEEQQKGICTHVSSQLCVRIGCSCSQGAMHPAYM